MDYLPKAIYIIKEYYTDGKIRSIKQLLLSDKT